MIDAGFVATAALASKGPQINKNNIAAHKNEDIIFFVIVLYLLAFMMFVQAS